MICDGANAVCVACGCGLRGAFLYSGCLFRACAARRMKACRQLPSGGKPEREGKAHPDQFALRGLMACGHWLNLMLRPQEGESPPLRERFRVSNAWDKARIQNAELAAGCAVPQCEQA